MRRWRGRSPRPSSPGRSPPGCRCWSSSTCAHTARNGACRGADAQAASAHTGCATKCWPMCATSPPAKDPARRTEPCLDQSGPPALQPPGREVLARWARLPQPFPVRALWLDGRRQHRGGPEPQAEGGPELPVSHRRGEAGGRNKPSPEGRRKLPGANVSSTTDAPAAGCPCGRCRPVVGLLAGGGCVARGLGPERRSATPCRVARGPRCQKRASAFRPILRQGRHEWQMPSVCSSKSGNS